MRGVTLSHTTRLILYIAMAILPVWIDFFKVSTDYSVRGLAMPILTSVNAAVIVTLAKTAPTNDIGAAPAPLPPQVQPVITRAP